MPRAEVKPAAVVQQSLGAVWWNDLETVGREIVGGAGAFRAARAVSEAEVRALPGTQNNGVRLEGGRATYAHIDQSCAGAKQPDPWITLQVAGCRSAVAQGKIPVRGARSAESAHRPENQVRRRAARRRRAEAGGSARDHDRQNTAHRDERDAQSRRSAGRSLTKKVRSGSGGRSLCGMPSKHTTTNLARSQSADAAA
jgi:hypothetical protein